MLFNSYVFLFLFLPLSLIGYYLFVHLGKGTAAKLVLTAASLIFYAYANPVYLLILLGSILFNYALCQGIVYERKRTGGRRAFCNALLIAGIAGNLGLLFYFKYYDFFVENLNAVFGTSFVLKGVILPLGISFFTFQQIGYVVDVWKGEAKVCSFLDYMLFVSYFPKLTQGPITVHEELLPQLAGIGKTRFSSERFTAGIYLFTMGMVKKVLVADTFGKAADWGYSNVGSLTGTDSLLLILFYALQLYFDFSGYCQMARGLSWIFGLELPVNFRSPYKASNIVDFWKGWHITLNRFFTRYIYIPLGGNRKGRWRMYANLLFIFLLSGLWHGAGWNFILWGALHGVLYLFTRMWQLHRKRVEDGQPVLLGKKKKSSGSVSAGRIAGTFLTFAFCCCAWVFFRAESVSQALAVFERLLHGGFALPSVGLMEGFNLDEFWYILKLAHLDSLPFAQYYLGIAITIGTLLVVFFAPNADEKAERFRPTAWNAAVTAFLFLWCTFSLSGVSSFLYFQF